MSHHLAAVILEDSSVLIEGRKYWEVGDIADRLVSALHSDPHLIVVIKPTNYQHYEGLIRLIHASTRADMPGENLLYTTEDGRVITVEALTSRNRPPSD